MKRNVMMVIVGLALIAGPAMADTLTVNATAAMNGTSYGLEVSHDNSSPAYVQDDTPTGESIYRFSFIYNPRAIGATGSNGWIMSIFGAMGDNPRPASATACPQAAHIPVFPARVMAFFAGPGQTIPGVRLTAMTNFCGTLGTPVIYWSENVPKRICGFVQSGTPLYAGIAVVDPGVACPPDGDPAYALAPQTGNNDEHAIEFARMGNLAVNPYGAGEMGSVYFDEFESFRTLAP